MPTQTASESRFGHAYAGLDRLSRNAQGARRRVVPRELVADFEELPLPLDAWLAHPLMANLAAEPLSPVQRSIVRHVEQIYRPETYRLLARHGAVDLDTLQPTGEVELRWRPVRMVNFLWMMVGKGGGKDRVAALALLRIAYLLLCLRKPSTYMGIGATSKIDLLNTATSEGQGEGIFYEELKGLLGNAPCFRDRYTETKKEIWFGRRIHSISGSSKEESQEGMNLLYGCLDEIDAFRTKEEIEKTARTARGAMLNAQGIFDMMRTSGSSRFPGAFKVLGLSWPRFVGSFIWRRVEESEEALRRQGSRSRTFHVVAPTWVSNPTKRESDFAAEFEENPELALAKYACQPPASESPYFRNLRAIEEAFSAPWPAWDASPVHREPMVARYYWGATPQEDMEEWALGLRPDRAALQPVEGWQVVFDFDPDFVCRDDFLRAIHIDLAVSSDRAGFAMSHVRGWTTNVYQQPNKETGVLEDVEVRRPLVTNDLITYLEAPKPVHGHPRGEIEIAWMRRLVFEVIARGFPVALVTFDGYQSTDSIQQLTARGIESDLFSLDRNMEGYDTAKSVLYTGGLEAYQAPLLVKELKALTVINGKKVDHPPGGSKDVADAWAGSVRGAIAVSELQAAAGDFEAPGMPQEEDLLRGLEPDLGSDYDPAGTGFGSDWAGPPR